MGRQRLPWRMWTWHLVWLPESRAPPEGDVCKFGTMVHTNYQSWECLGYKMVVRRLEATVLMRSRQIMAHWVLRACIMAV